MLGGNRLTASRGPGSAAWLLGIRGRGSAGLAAGSLQRAPALCLLDCLLSGLADDTGRGGGHTGCGRRVHTHTNLVNTPHSNWPIYGGSAKPDGDIPLAKSRLSADVIVQLLAR